jgi:multidrug efflux pump subunit AcrA (membrane-fusion protein)
MTASVRIETDARADVLLAPNVALRWRPTGTAASGPAVWVPGLNGNPQIVPVRVGLSEGSVTEISTTQPLHEVIVGMKQ